MTNTKRMFRGDNKNWRLTVKDKDGVVVDITGGTIEYTLRGKASDPTYLIYKSSVNGVTEVDISDPTNGIAIIHLEPADTRDLEDGTYIYDVQYTDSAGDIFTVIKDNLILEDDVTRP